MEKFCIREWGEWVEVDRIDTQERTIEIAGMRGSPTLPGEEPNDVWEALAKSFHDLDLPGSEEERERQTKLRRIKRKLLGLQRRYSYEKEKFVLKATFIVGVTRIYLKGKEIILTVKPKIENLNSSRMLVETLSHPQVAPHIKMGETYEILTDAKPIEIEEVPNDYLLFLMIHYLKILNDLVRRGLQRNYRTTTENLRGRIRGRLLVGQTVRRNWPRGRKHYAYCSYQTYSEDTLENRILKAAYLKARSYLNSINAINGELAEWISNVGVDMERVSTVRIYPTDFALVTVQRIRPDYRQALDLARIVLRTLGYDPTVEAARERIRYIYPYWIDMNELFERYVEVKLRRGEIGVLKDYRVYPGYGYGGGIPIKEDKIISDGREVKELRPDFILVKDGKIAIGDAKYKEAYGNGWKKEDLQQIALYGRIKWEKIKKWIKKKHGVDEKINGDGQEPYLYIFYPAEKDTQKEPAKSFRGMHKVGIKVPVV